MNILHVKENINLDEELPKFGFVKAREYFHCDNISVRICDREVVLSVTVPALRYASERKFPISNLILKMMSKGILE